MYLRSLKKCTYNRNNRPESWQEFERLVRDCAELKFKKEFRFFGRSGQKQYGIDIFSRDWSILIQCKDYTDDESLIKKIDGDYETAKAHFSDDGKPFFKTYIVATTLLRSGRSTFVSLGWMRTYGSGRISATSSQSIRFTMTAINS